MNMINRYWIISDIEKAKETRDILRSFYSVMKD